MNTNRRSLLGSIAGIGALTPFLSLKGAMAAVDDKAKSVESTVDKVHESMSAIPGMKMYGSEQIAMLLYPGFTPLDLVGPQHFFSGMMGAKVHLVTTEATLAPVASDLGLAITPTVTMTDAPKDLDILFVGGGLQGTINAMSRKDVIGFLADRGSRAKYITSVCTGSMLLGQAGLLKGKRATSHWIAREVLPQFGATQVDARVVIDGNVITAAGVTAGLDFAITVVSALRGKPYAQALMLDSEYHPEPPMKGGTVATTDPTIAKLMQDMMAPAVVKFREVAGKI